MNLYLVYKRLNPLWTLYITGDNILDGVFNTRAEAVAYIAAQDTHYEYEVVKK
jgi:hypothetical protein